MQVNSINDETGQDTRPAPRGYRSVIVIFCVLFAILLLTLVPPLINVSRFQRRIEGNISNSVGRPVHFKNVTLTLFPVPGFTLEEFVVDEDAAFGSEPILRADEVKVNLRLNSIWRRHVEFSKISLTEPHVNLVRAANGKWNIESLLLQASQIQAAPTAQPFAGYAPRFPYIEATGARVNLKLDRQKTPFSFTDADFALWLPEAHQWHLRLEAHPTRTDTVPGDTGILKMEGTLGGAEARTSGAAAALGQIPINFQGAWQNAQLGGLSRLLFGDDAGLRGDISLTFGMLGTIEHNSIATNIKVKNARRADFVPLRPLSLEAACHAIAGDTFHSFTSIECDWPPPDSSDASTLIVAANLPDVSSLQSGSVQVTLPALPAATFFDWLSVATPHPPIGLTGPGTLSGSLIWGSDLQFSPFISQPQSTWTGDLEFSGGLLQLDPAGQRSIPLGDIVLRSTPPSVAPKLHVHVAPAPTVVGINSFDLLPISLPLGGKQPAILEGHLDTAGYTLHLTGVVLCADLLAVGNAVPQLGDGLRQILEKIAPAAPDPNGKPDTDGSEGNRSLTTLPIRLDLTATRAWGDAQVWRETTPVPTHPRREFRR
jgi:hypothetical protein